MADGRKTPYDRVKEQNDALRAAIDEARGLVEGIQGYLQSGKFTAPGADWVGVSTDMSPRLSAVRAALAPV